MYSIISADHNFLFIDRRDVIFYLHRIQEMDISEVPIHNEEK